jgi:glycerophosphoryl diester phosphodiesterase
MMPYPLANSTQIIAHRGNSGPSPENTRLAIEQAIDLGVDMVEVDVHISQDGIPVLIHHSRLEYTTNGQGYVSEHNLSELRLLDIGGWKAPEFAGERILTLHDVLDLARNRISINLDIKTERVIPATIKIIQEMGVLNQVVISGCTQDYVKNVLSREPHLTVLLNLDGKLEQLALTGPAPLFRSRCLSVAEQSGAAGINIAHVFINRLLVQQAHQKGLSVWAWTVDDEERVQELLEMGVDSITTNWPEQMMTILKKWTVNVKRDGQ